MDEKRRVELTVEDIFFLRLALHAKQTEYKELIKKEKQRAWTKEQQERVRSLCYFLRGYEHGYKAITNAKQITAISSEQPKESK